MRWTISILVLATIVLGFGCSKQPAAPAAANPQATLVLRDGTTFAGAVTKSSPTEITVQAPGGESRTYPMSQVASVQYGEQPQPAAANNLQPAPVPAPAVAPNPTGTPVPRHRAPAPAPAPPSAPPPEAAPASAPARHAPSEPAEVVRVVPSGTKIVVRNNEAIDSKTAAAGQTYSGVVAEPVADADGRVAIPKGANATLVVRSVAAQGRIEGQSQLALDVDSVEIGGRRYRLDTQDVTQQGRAGIGKNKRTAVFVGGAGALGTILGAVAGGGKGAAIGALSGAAAGGAAQTLTRGKGVKVPPETLLTFQLDAPVRITEMR